MLGWNVPIPARSDVSAKLAYSDMSVKSGKYRIWHIRYLRSSSLIQVVLSFLKKKCSKSVVLRGNSPCSRNLHSLLMISFKCSRQMCFCSPIIWRKLCVIHTGSQVSSPHLSVFPLRRDSTPSEMVNVFRAEREQKGERGKVEHKTLWNSMTRNEIISSSLLGSW